MTRYHGRPAVLLLLALITTACSSNSARPDTTSGDPSTTDLVGQWEDTDTMPIEFRADGEVHHDFYGRGTYRIESDGRLRMDFDGQSVFATFTVDGSDTITMNDHLMGETYVLYRKDTGAREAALKAQTDADRVAEDASATASAVVPQELIGRWELIEAFTERVNSVSIDIRADNTIDLPAVFIGGQEGQEGSYEIDNSDTKYGNHDGSMIIRFSGGQSSKIGYRIDRENYPEYGEVLILFLEDMGLETMFLQRAE